MLGQMMHRPLLLTEILKYAEVVNGENEIVTKTVEGDIHRYTYADMGQRARQMAKVLMNLGVEAGDRVATLAWNSHRHMELYYAIAGIGAVCHTINPRLSAEQLIYITNHADDKVVFVDVTFVPVLEALQGQLPPNMRYVILAERANMPDTKLPNVLCYEELIASEGSDFDWPEFDENQA